MDVRGSARPPSVNFSCLCAESIQPHHAGQARALAVTTGRPRLVRGCQTSKKRCAGKTIRPLFRENEARRFCGLGAPGDTLGQHHRLPQQELNPGGRVADAIKRKKRVQPDPLGRERPWAAIKWWGVGGGGVSWRNVGTIIKNSGRAT